ncbi:MAG: hypothetical protein ABI780_14775 [Ardenticatenales bacterium]
MSPAALEDAIYVCTMFSIIVRMADTLEFYLPDEAGYLSDAGSLLKRGYKM